MDFANSENILHLLLSYNPWWQTGTVRKNFSKPIKRFAYYKTIETVTHPDIRRFAVLCGARRTGKTTILYQIIDFLLRNTIPPKNILFISFDHPLLKICSIENIMDIYKSNITNDEKVYCFFDEIQYASHWNSWLKILYDNNPEMQIVATGSASPILSDKISESGLGRWNIIHVPTLSFYEYCELLKVTVPVLPSDIDIMHLYLRPLSEQTEIFNKLSALQLPFLRYLQVGGFPELALSSDDYYSQRILREDIVDKALKRDLPSVYDIRNIGDLEKIFLYLCYTSSNIINIQTLSKEMENMSRNTAEKYIRYLESAHLIYVSPQINIEAKQILKSQDKIYIADAAMRNAVLMKDDITGDQEELGIIAETAVYKHIKNYFENTTAQVGYYRGGNKNKEIDIVAVSGGTKLMIEVKYREQAKIGEDDLIVNMANEITPNLVITKRATDFGECSYGDKKIYRIPAPAFLYLLDWSKKQKNHFTE